MIGIFTSPYGISCLQQIYIKWKNVQWHFPVSPFNVYICLICKDCSNWKKKNHTEFGNRSGGIVSRV